MNKVILMWGVPILILVILLSLLIKEITSERNKPSNIVEDTIDYEEEEQPETINKYRIITDDVPIIRLGLKEGELILKACEKAYIARTYKKWDGFCHKEDGFNLFLDPR